MCKFATMAVCSWTSGRRALQGPVVCVNPLKAFGSVLGDFSGFLPQLRGELVRTFLVGWTG